MMHCTGLQRFVCIPMALALGCTQLPAPVIDPAACTYDRCGLWRGGSKVYRGSAGEVVASMGGLLPSSLERYLVGNDSAISLARQYRFLHTQSRLALVAASPVVYTAPILVIVGLSGGSPSPGVWGVLAGGGALLIFSAIRAEQAFAKVGRAIFLYNRDLPRSSPDSVKPKAAPPQIPLRPDRQGER